MLSEGRGANGRRSMDDESFDPVMEDIGGGADADREDMEEVEDRDEATASAAAPASAPASATLAMI